MFQRTTLTLFRFKRHRWKCTLSA